jgi:anti-sigma regulatory factor (Ser/Thr protein kinase)
LLREGGRGVFLIRHLADAVEFRPGDPGMHIMITYSLPV